MFVTHFLQCFLILSALFSGKMTAAARKKAAALIASTEALSEEDRVEAALVLTDWADTKGLGDCNYFCF